MNTNPAEVAAIPKVLHLGVNRENHVAPGERVLFAGPGEFAVVFPGDSPFNEHVFSDTHAKTQPVRPCHGRFQYYWAQGGEVAAGVAAAGVVISGVVAPVLPMSPGTTARGGPGIIIVV